MKGCLADVFVKVCSALKRFARFFLRVKDSNGFMKTICHYLNRSAKVGIAADYHGAFEGVVKRVHQQMRREVYI